MKLFVGYDFMLKFLLLMIILFLSSCSGKELCKTNQIKRISSPDKKVDLIWVQEDCGATTAIADHIYFAKSGVEFSELGAQHPVFIADKAFGLDAFWQKDKLVVIRFDDARIFQFKNFWHSRDLDSFKYFVKIILDQNEDQK